MRIPTKEIRSRQRVGQMGGRPVYQVATVGGLHVVGAAGAGGDFEILGIGSHPLLARHLAERHEGVQFDDLAKSERVDPACFGDLLGQYAAITAELRRMQGR